VGANKNVYIFLKVKMFSFPFFVDVLITEVQCKSYAQESTNSF